MNNKLEVNGRNKKINLLWNTFYLTAEDGATFPNNLVTIEHNIWWKTDTKL